MLNEKGKQDFEKRDSGIEYLIVFGSMQFGADALEKWGDEKFFYRTGIALEIWKQQHENKM
ncbi:hypothetical protein OK18_19095 [Chryseobacterium gallinarum]|uniref:Uncharacterized protein n=1 Tax=Chryseobacterium gallinarum TaxID=1324352 RepID=A0A0G3M6A9_CHRGL|nr:hypothetical protein [Chryseobacterium gallinarum]AKK74439.1 hypothetical protein OK18_19095 [Chryseobacterium gallinarum]